MTQRRRKRNIRYGRLVFAVACLLFVGFGITRILARPDPYKGLKDVGNENKTAGTKEDIIEEISDEKMRFLHYPSFDQEQADQKIAEVIKSLPDKDGITFLDYESSDVLDQYWSVTLHYQLLDMEQNLQAENYQSFTFHKDSGEEVKLEDVLRRDYVDMVKEQFKKQANITLEDLNAVTFAIKENGLELTAQNGKVTLSYADFKPYIKIPGKGIAEVHLEIKRNVEIDPNKPMVALTFDDGPSPYTDEVMSVFEKYHATASFFMLGQNIQSYPDTVKHMVEYGFEICNHSLDHQSIASDDKAFIANEIYDTQDILYKMTGHEPTRIRPPYGEYNDLTYEVANGNGVHITLWNVDTEDWSNRDKNITLERAKAGAYDGAIILFHDLYPTSLEAVKELIPYLQAEGYQLVTVSDLFQYKGDLTGL